MASPGPRPRQHVWQPAELPAGEPDVTAFHSCTCGTERKTSPGRGHSPRYAYRPVGTSRWQDHATGCGRPSAPPRSRAKKRITTGSAS